MQISVLADEGLKKSFKCVIPAGEVEVAMDQELKRIGQSVKIAGFRPGFVPMKILQQRYGKSVQQDVIRNLVTDSATKAIQQRNLRPALTPNVENQQYQEGGELSFTLTMEVLPDLPEMKFSDISLTREVFDIEESDIDEGLQRLAERSPQLAALPESAKAKEGNVVNMDFRGTIDGVAFDGGTAEQFQIELGSGRLIDGFEKQLIGVKAGDTKDVRVTFPQDYFNADVAGKEAVFAVTVRDVSELKTPEMTDEFAKSKGFSDIRALREAVRDQLMKDFKSIVRTRLKKQLFDTLEGRCDFPVPAGMSDLEFNSIWQQLQQAKAQGDETVAGKSDDELRTEYKAIAERRVRLGILLAEIARREKLQVGRDELTRALIQHASQYPGQEQRVMEFYRQHPERLDELRGPILEEKAVDWILGKVNMTDTKIVAADLFKDEEDESAEKPKAAKPKKAATKKDEAEGEAKPKAAKKKSAKSTEGDAE